MPDCDLNLSLLQSRHDGLRQLPVHSRIVVARGPHVDVPVYAEVVWAVADHIARTRHGDLGPVRHLDRELAEQVFGERCAE
eukprot:CAMPEP_0196729286 /NCGR_PEP_ID=MMETSP1091-20130531/9725_1 /TAXON_ID=302021 /ORGANISM="Rhodomonas sp., Strain CCMP768" /LENGTH=80 /DNA_ID=CAMNT_0042072157 /DNA_START=150 /DNA_END=389 /DNA_ORIENTATION=-